MGGGEVVDGVGLEVGVLLRGEAVENGVVDHVGGRVGHDELAAADEGGCDDTHAFAGDGADLVLGWGCPDEVLIEAMECFRLGEGWVAGEIVGSFSSGD